MASIFVFASIISIATSVSIKQRRLDKQPFTAEIFHNFKAEVLALIQCDDRDGDCPGLVFDHPDVTQWDTMSATWADKMLIPGIIRLAFHDCAESDPQLIAEGEKNEFQLSRKAGNAGGCNGCLDLNDPNNDNLLDGSILPFEPICQYYLPYISRADCWALAATIASEFSATLLSLNQGFPFFLDTESAVTETDIPYWYGRVDCEPDDPNVPYQSPATASFTLPTATLGWSHQSYFFKSRFGWDSNEFESEYFTNKDIVGLIAGGHSVGRAHEKISGFSGQWDFSENTLDNMWISTMFNEEYITTYFAIGRPTFGPLCPVPVLPSQGTFTACLLPYDPDECAYSPATCPLPDGHPLKLPNGQCVGQTENTRYYMIPAGTFGPLPMICSWFHSEQNWNMAVNMNNFGGPQFAMLQPDDFMDSCCEDMQNLDPPLLSNNVALNTDMSLLWDLSWYLENGRARDIDCNTDAVKLCPDGSTVLTAQRSQNTAYTRFNIGKTGGELGEIYVCPQGATCCDLVQCPVQCEGGLTEFNRLVDNDLIQTLPDDSDCIIALSYRYSMRNKRQVRTANRNMGTDYGNAFKKMITIGYYDREHNDYELYTVGDEDGAGNGNGAAANLISMEKGTLAAYSVLMVVGMVTFFGLCVCGYCFWHKKQSAKVAVDMKHLQDTSVQMPTHVNASSNEMVNVTAQESDVIEL